MWLCNGKYSSYSEDEFSSLYVQYGIEFTNNATKLLMIMQENAFLFLLPHLKNKQVSNSIEISMSAFF